MHVLDDRQWSVNEGCDHKQRFRKANYGLSEAFVRRDGAYQPGVATYLALEPVDIVAERMDSGNAEEVDVANGLLRITQQPKSNELRQIVSLVSLVSLVGRGNQFIRTLAYFIELVF